MSYNYHNQAQAQPQTYQNYQNYPQTGTYQAYPQAGTTTTQNQYTQHQTVPQHSSGTNDPFFNFGDNAFNMDIRDDFEDPFEMAGNRMGGFGFPNIRALEQQMLGQFQNEMQHIQQLGDGNQQNINNQLAQGNNGGQSGLFVSMQGAGSGPGTMISKTYLSKVDYSSGQPKEESYQSQAIKQFGEGGHSISERQEAYKNSTTGVQKAAHQRLLDDRGTKLIKQRNINTGEQSEHNILKGLTENEVGGFNQQYNDYREKVHFQDNYKYLNDLNPGKMMKQLGQGKGKEDNNLLLGDGNNYNFGNNFGNNYGNTTNTPNTYQQPQYPTSNTQYYNPGTQNQQNNNYHQYQNNPNNYHF